MRLLILIALCAPVLTAARSVDAERTRSLKAPTGWTSSRSTRQTASPFWTDHPNRKLFTSDYVSSLVVFNDAAGADHCVHEMSSLNYHGGPAAFNVHRFHHIPTVVKMDLSPVAREHLVNSGMVKSIEANGPVEKSFLGRSSTDGVQPGATWGLDRIDEESLPLDGQYDYPPAGGSPVAVCILDTGIYTEHPEFEGWAFWAVNTIDDEDWDGNGHGTHVAGTVMSTTWGVTKSLETTVELYAVKVLDSTGSGTFESVIGGIDWVIGAVLETGGDLPVMISMSLGGGVNSALNEAIQTAYEVGVVSVVSAGNEAGDACTRSPASAPNAVTVAATDNSDTRAWFSNFGDCVDVFGPGVNIESTWNDGGSNTISGTSMSCPHVTGIMASMYSSSFNCESGQPASGTVRSQRAIDHFLSFATVGQVIDPVGSPNLLTYNPPAGTALDCDASPVTPSNTPTASATPSATPSASATPSFGSPPSPPPTSPPPTPTNNPSPPPTPTNNPSPPPTPGCSYAKLVVQPDNHPWEFGWHMFYQEGNYYIAGGGSEGGEGELCAPGHYTVTVHDSRGDGICCADGEGWWYIELDGEILYWSNGEFGETENFIFTVGDLDDPSEPRDPPYGEEVEFSADFAGHKMSFRMVAVPHGSSDTDGSTRPPKSSFGSAKRTSDSK